MYPFSQSWVMCGNDGTVWITANNMRADCWWEEYDSFKTGELCDLIFFTDHPNIWHKAINHYSSVKQEGICNGWKVKMQETM
ncbi:hypothetical protein QQF64_033741 [Cirrhinus molitorella]|uniref:Uncharacterized protein n=1 Tax=Cirrhinus molitorella TaxID=172907 RepID=A0ABR3MUS4_9TELE